MFGVPLGGDNIKGDIDPAHIYCDNETVVKNSTKIESTLNKKHSSLAYHFTRWQVAAGVIALAWIVTTDNLADAFTKLLPQTTRDYLFDQWTY